MTDHPEESSPVLTVKEVATRLGVSAAKVRSMILGDAIEAFVSQGNYRIREDAVDHYLERQLTQPGPRGTPVDAADVVAYMAEPKLTELPMLLSVKETARFLRMSTPGVRRAIHRGDLPSVEWSNRRLVPVPQLVAMLSGMA